MLLVKAKRGRSRINGDGLIAREFIAKGSAVWRFEAAVDRKFTVSDVARLPHKEAQEVLYFAFFDREGDVFVLSGDDDRFTNHSSRPNTRFTDRLETVATRDIRPGAEITWDYLEIEMRRPRTNE